MDSFSLNDTIENETLFDSFPFENETKLDSFTSDSAEEIFISKAVVNCSILPILFFIGIFGNISTIIVFFLQKKKSASTYFIIGLAFSDLLVLILRFITNIYVIGHLFFTETFRYVKPSSFVWTAFSLSPQRSGNLFILVICIERLTAVWIPLHVRQIWTAKKARITLIIIALLSSGDLIIAYDVLVFSLNEKVPVPGVLSTQSEAWRYIKSQKEIVATLSFVYRMAFDVMPLPLLLILNVAIIIGINRNMFSRKGMNAKTQERKDKEQRITRMLLAISTLYILLCGPFNLYANLIAIRAIRGADVPLPAYETFKMLNVLNSVINFVVYGINDKSLRSRYFMLWRCQKNQVPYLSG